MRKKTRLRLVQGMSLQIHKDISLVNLAYRLGLSMVRSITNMLGGSIDIRSQVGKGTEVKISLPLIRTPTLATPVSTPSTTASKDRTQDDSVSILQAQASGTVVSLYGFDELSNTLGLSYPEVGRVLRHYISAWYGLEVLPSWPPSTRPDIIIVDEKHLPTLLSGDSQGASIISISSNSSRYVQSTIRNDAAGIVEYVSKPFGPYKLAKALRQCLEKSKALRGGLYTVSEVVTDNILDAEINPPVKEFEAVMLTEDDEITPIYVQTNGKVMAAKTENAHMALESSSDATSTNGDAELGEPAFPFPLQATPLEVNSAKTTIDVTERENRRPDSKERRAKPELLDKGDLANGKSRLAANKPGSTVSAISRNFQTPPTPDMKTQSPRLLLVDDNKINLRLLQTFMKKRKYKLVDSAVNGYLAVQAVEAHEDGYDVIFMDISMPVMDGFQATRAIRGLEASRQEARLLAGDTSERFSPALIIALTGLASSKDQSEAFSSGVDLFMTKPISFKEIGRLLDNWEANSESAGHDGGGP